MNTIKKLDRTRFLDKTLEYIAVACLIISVIGAFVGVILRYQFGVSYQVLEEICRYAIVYGVFAFIGPLIKKDEHLKMSLLQDSLKGKAKNIIDLFISILLFASFLFLFWAGIKWSMSLLEMKIMTLSGAMLMFIPAMAIVVGMLFGCIYSIFQIFKDIYLIRHKEQKYTEEGYQNRGENVC